MIHSELNLPPDSCNLIDCEYKLTGLVGKTMRSEDEITNFSVSITGGVELQSWFIEEKIVPYKDFREFKSSFDGEYADFIVGYDPNKCEEIKVSCANDDDKSSRTCFKKEVLEEYGTDVSCRAFITEGIFHRQCVFIHTANTMIPVYSEGT